jgi:hypothetical protein
MHASGGGAHPKRFGDVIDRSVRVVMEDDRGSLLVGQPAEQSKELLGGLRLVYRIGEVRNSVIGSTPTFELAGGHAEGNPPDPCARVTDLATPAERLGESLSRGVASDVAIARVRQ